MANTQPLQTYLRQTQPRSEAVPVREMTPMLLLGLLKKIAQTRSALRNRDLLSAGFYLGRATCIVDTLRNELDLESGDELALGYEQFYSLIDECLQKATKAEAEHYLDLAEEYLNRASDWWVFSGEGYGGQVGHA